MSYQRLTLKERYQIAALKKSGHGIRKISRVLDRSPSSVSREIRLNGGWMGYDAVIAQSQVNTRLKEQKHGPPRKIRGKMEAYVRKKILSHWSPEQISGRSKRDRRDSISYSSIYRFVYREARAGGELWRCLRTHRKKRKHQKRSILSDNLNIYKNARSIGERPKIVEIKKRLGDLERDLICGSKAGAVILTVNDRVSRKVKVAWLKQKTSKLVHQKTVALIKKYPKVRTLTNDQGTEFAQHRLTEKSLGAKVYFAHKGCAWERGANENTNGLLRQYFPRSMNFNGITQKQIRDAENRLNTRPRKCLGYRTPNEVY